MRRRERGQGQGDKISGYTAGRHIVGVHNEGTQREDKARLGSDDVRAAIAVFVSEATARADLTVCRIDSLMTCSCHSMFT